MLKRLRKDSINKKIYNNIIDETGDRSRKPKHVEFNYKHKQKKNIYKMANLINESEIRGTWAPIIEEATGINESEKLAWMSTYCHNHKLYEDAQMMALNPVSAGTQNIGGMGAVVLPDATASFANQRGSGDKAPTLLPLAMQVAAQTIALDLVPVVPMAGPMGLLSYLDFVYEGGRVDGGVAPTYIKSEDANGEGAADGYKFTKLDKASRIDGFAIYEVEETDVHADTLLAAFRASGTAADDAVIELVKALEDHIPGFSGAGAFSGENGVSDVYPMNRETGERTPDKIMGLSLFSKSVAAETFQVAAAVTREQVQDLKQFGVDAVAQVEAVLTNELTQSINQHILAEMRRLAGLNSDAALGDLQLAGEYNQGGNTFGDVNRRILTHILAHANFIANKGRRGAGNFAVVSAKIASVLQGVAGFVPNPMANTINQVAGAIYPLGSVAGINIYTDPTQAFGSGDVLIGRKGDGNGPGLVFMPYLMAESVQTIAEGTMAPKVAVKSRYALVEAGFHPQTQYSTFEASGVKM